MIEIQMGFNGINGWKNLPENITECDDMIFHNCSECVYSEKKARRDCIHREVLKRLGGWYRTKTHCNGIES